MPIDPINPDYTDTMEAVRAARALHEASATQQAAPARPAAGTNEAEAYLSHLAQRYPSLNFTLGQGVAGMPASQREALGKGNVMLDPNFAVQLRHNPEEARKYEKVFEELANSFERLFADAGGTASALTAWGTFLGFEGGFNSWGIASPFIDLAPTFALFDSALMVDVVKIATKLYQEEIKEEQDLFKIEQNLEQAEEAIDRQQGLNPHIGSKREAIHAYQTDGAKEPEEGKRLNVLD
ncbi:MAG: hypothetical protein GXY32_11495 [Ruminococcaceae bacterium]|nr:hypothetical protein [Oscillospiraceae bacterium]